MKKLGVKQGDRVVVYMPNIPKTVVALLQLITKHEMKYAHLLRRSKAG
ncbi:hypothetical protein ABTG33_18525 [Acinetobacter baumannii]